MWFAVAKSFVATQLDINFLRMKFRTKMCHKKYLFKPRKMHSLAGNRTPVSCVTDRDTHHYTTKDLHTCTGFCCYCIILLIPVMVSCTFQYLICPAL